MFFAKVGERSFKLSLSFRTLHHHYVDCAHRAKNEMPSVSPCETEHNLNSQPHSERLACSFQVMGM